jgi:hypothetical protein
MSTEEADIVQAVAIGSLAFAFGLVWWWVRRGAWKRRFGPIAAYVSLTIFLYLIVTALAWCVSLLPPINDPRLTTYLGIGGGMYATNYALYPRAMAWWCAMALLVFLCAESGSVWVTARRPPSIPGGRPPFRMPRKMAVDLCGILLVAAVIIAFIAYYETVGWGSLVWSDRPRFELNGMIAESTQEVRWSLPVFLATGVCAALFLCLRGNPVMMLFVWVLSIIPFLAFASRGLSVLAVAGGIAVLLRYRRFRLLTALPVLVVVAVCIWLPLRLREEPNTGLRVAWDVATGQTGGTFRSNGWNNVAILMLQNTGAGFGVFCEVMSRRDGATADAPELAPGYMRLSFSPLPSSLDGFATRFLNRDPRVNPFTPYSAFAELLAYSSWALFAVPALAAIVTMVFLVRPREPGKVWMICSLVVGILVVNGFVQASQYAVRTASRFIYLAWIIGSAEIAFRWLWAVAHRRRRAAS